MSLGYEGPNWPALPKAGPPIAWNGGICGTCNATYIGSHTCSREDILARVKALLAVCPGEPVGIWIKAPDDDGTDW